MSKSIKRAKELYFYYAGSRFHMSREGALKEYIKCGASEEDERRWLYELADQHFSKLSEPLVADRSFETIADLICLSKNEDVLLKLLAVVEKEQHHLDTFTGIRVCETLLGVHEALPNAKLANAALNLARDVLEGAENRPYAIHAYYKALSYMDGLLDESIIRERIQKNRRRLERMNPRANL